ncbi:MAG TPA: 4-aminobutyrate--2-oxoglutarate transaminase [Jiangellales bacterium]|nr:4-aminobutyrate--2-oxoglutarate transaminase [Jiangellales bacterium]
MSSVISLKTAIPGPESLRWMERRQQSVARGPYHTLPVFIARGSGAMLEDVDGNRLLDFAGGLGCLNVGHAAPLVVEAISRQAAKYVHSCVHVTPNDGYVRLAEALNARCPGRWPKKTLLVNSGAEAVENAIKIARAYTGRQAVIAFEDAFHGRTLLALTLTSKTHPYKAGFGPFAPEVYRMPYAYCYRCAYGRQYPECGAHCARQLRDVFRKSVAAESVAAVIVEPVLGEGGFVDAPPEFLTTLAAIAREHGVLVIADEVQSGYGRTGTFFACEQAGLEPDLLVAGKSIAGGLPLASVTGRAEVMDAPGVGALGGTYGGNPVACAAALAAMRTMDTLDLSTRAREIEAVMGGRLRALADRFPVIREVRGRGAMLAVELADPASSEPAAALTTAVSKHCHGEGLVTLTCGTYGNVLRFLPPLVMPRHLLDEGLDILDSAFAACV